MVRSTDRPAMTIAVDLGRKATKQTNKSKNLKQKGYDTLDYSPEFLALEALLYVRTDYRDRSMSLCGSSY